MNICFAFCEKRGVWLLSNMIAIRSFLSEKSIASSAFIVIRAVAKASALAHEGLKTLAERTSVETGLPVL